MGVITDLASRSPPWASFAYGLLPIAFVALFVSIEPAQRPAFSANAFRGGLLWLTFVGVTAFASDRTALPCGGILGGAFVVVIVLVALLLWFRVPLWCDKK